MAITIVKAAAKAADQFFWGIRVPEVGINVRSIQIRYFPEVNERYKNASGETFVRSVSVYFSREISMQGEITGTTGIMAFTLGIACTFSATEQFFIAAPGSFFLDEAVISAERRGWRSMSVRASSSPYL